MVTYTIYEIPGIKVGCTNDIAKRGLSWCLDERYANVVVCEVIERVEDDAESWQFVGDREIWWQDELGYKRDSLHYKQIREHTAGSKMYEARLRGNARVQELGRCGFSDPEVVKKAGQRGSKRVNELGKGGFQRRMTCQYCGLEGSNGAMHRWHGENCKHRSKS